MKKGFTLLETLVAIAILLIAVVGPMSTIGGSLSQIGTARDQMIAINLAQEGIEAVRQKRDSNMLARWQEGTLATGYNPSLATTDWLAGLPDCSSRECILSVNPLQISACSSANCSSSEKLVLQDVNGWYYQGGSGTATKFSRTIKITGSGDERMVTSTVTWLVGGTTRTIEIKESIFGINN